MSSVLVKQSLFSGNFAHNDGGAINIYVDDVISPNGIQITNSTFFANTSLSKGGAINTAMQYGKLDISHTTITQNQSKNDSYPSGGIYHWEGKLNIKNSVISHNYNNFSLADCYSSDTSLFYTNRNNVIAEPNNCPFNATYDFISLIDQVELLADNGGPTKTCKPKEDSMLINSGLCTDNNGNTVSKDQRSIARNDGKCDIGAYEEADLNSNLPAMFYLLLN